MRACLVTACYIKKEPTQKIYMWFSYLTFGFIAKGDACLYAMFIASLFIVDKQRNQPRHTSTNKINNKTWPVFTMEFYSAINE